MFTGHKFADGGNFIRKILKQRKVPASFFFTGTFYENRAFKPLITTLKNDGHYLGAHSDQHLLYADWQKRDSLLITRKIFEKDLLNNYERMMAHGIAKEQAAYFLPPFEWYNKAIAQWTGQLGLQLINYSAGTRSAADYTWPEMGDRYLSSEMIFQSILIREAQEANGLNGFILLLHLGTDPRRTDKFYYRLDDLIVNLHQRGYRFVRIDQLLQ